MTPSGWVNIQYVTQTGVTLPLPTSQVWALLVTRCDVLSVTGRALLRGHTNKFVTFIGHVQLTCESHTWPSMFLPVVVNVICYQWWDESVVAGLPLSRHNLIKLLPATPRGISLYIIQATEVSLKLEYFCISLFLSISRSQDECFEIFSGLCITGFSSQLVLSANIIHHHKLNLQIEFSALCSQEWLQCCRCEAWDNDELSSVTRPCCHPPEE